MDEMTFAQWREKYGTHTLRLLIDRLADSHYKRDGNWSKISVKLHAMLRELEQVKS